jgi:hypothetical protein
MTNKTLKQYFSDNMARFFECRSGARDNFLVLAPTLSPRCLVKTSEVVSLLVAPFFLNYFSACAVSAFIVTELFALSYAP